jgi:putative glycosyltransferase (TIGR04348 family)
MARIGIVTPIARTARTGNRVTAARWARLLRELGHGVQILPQDDVRPVDVMIALHARRSAAAAQRYKRRVPDGRVVVALTGTDLYRDLPESRQAGASLDLADAIIVLQPKALESLRGSWRRKAHVVYQSVSPIAPQRPRSRTFDVCVVGHLRDVKDPLRPALAARGLPASSAIRVVQIGAALTATWHKRAEREMEVNPRYRWLGERSRYETRRWLARSRLMALPSRLEGGANVIGEAVVAGTPILASRIDGCVGLLGVDHPGWFAVGDTLGLRELMLRAETDPAFQAALLQSNERVRSSFSPDAERQALRQLIQALTPRAVGLLT